MKLEITLSKRNIATIKSCLLLEEQIEKSATIEDVIKELFFLVYGYGDSLDLRGKVKIKKIPN
jgi:hypothetical protein